MLETGVASSLSVLLIMGLESQAALGSWLRVGEATVGLTAIPALVPKEVLAPWTAGGIKGLGLSTAGWEPSRVSGPGQLPVLLDSIGVVDCSCALELLPETAGAADRGSAEDQVPE